MICAATKKDSNLQDLIKFLQTGKWPNEKSSDIQCYFSRKQDLSIVDDCVMYGERIIIPSCFRKRILKELHKGHHGIERTKALARSYVYWPHMDDEIKRYVQNCAKCSSVAKSLPKTSLYSWPLTKQPMERVHIDIAGPVDNFYYFVIVDSFSKWPQIYQIKSISSNSIINCMRDFTSLFGNPELIVSDNGTQFSSSMFSKFCQENGILHKFTAPYHPQSNGQAERFVDTLKRALKKLEGTGTSSENLQTFLKCYRSSPNPSSGGKSPSELFVGRKIRINLDLLKKPTESQLQRNEKMEEQYNKRNGAKERIYNIGQKVYAKLYKLNKSEWFPGIIKRKLGNVNYEVEIENIPEFRAVRSHTNQLRPRYSESENIAANDVLFDYFNLTAQQTPPRDQNMRDNEIEYVPLTDGQTTSTDELQPVQDPLLVTSPSGSTNVNSQPTTLEKLTSTLEEGATTSNSTTDPVIQTDEASPALRRSNRRKRPPVWTPDYHLLKRKRDVGNPK
ncbi:uncharacterized protein K02A2.6-like [Lucilia sericata]|uniref:uncharacterized protein K02A2.6-like n=1 Tax=Lucilia sericata TaxID=13632 RepID=UPI0018A82726|nr:uncharacterized protein K02A2.6-like [Lucilia sericata]